MKIYISGAISSIPLTEALRLFGEAENYLKSLGHEVINPMTHNHNHGRTWGEYMAEDLNLLLNSGCTAIYMLKNWHTSRGAIIEYITAQAMGIKFMYEDPCLAPIYINVSPHSAKTEYTTPIVIFHTSQYCVTSPQHPQAPYETPSTLTAASGKSNPNAKNER